VKIVSDEGPGEGAKLNSVEEYLILYSIWFASVWFKDGRSMSGPKNGRGDPAYKKI
jgi:hypothetical protein